jgi:hypothetical protein
MMSRATKLLAIAGILALVTAFTLPRFALRPPRRPQVTRVDLSFEFGTTMIASGWATDSVSIEYPSQIKITDTGLLRVVFLPEGPGNDKLRKSRFGREGKLARDTMLSLSGAAFDVAPTSAITRPAGTSVPVQWLWTLSPKKEGRQYLTVSIDDLKLSKYHGGDIRINGRRRLAGIVQSPDEQALPIIVLTREGLTVEYYLLIRLAILILGFILLYPAVVSWVADSIRKRSERRASMIIRP